MISDSNPETTGSDTCSVCLLSYVNPVRLPCGHIFCFLCTKGAANLNHSCALCRKPFPRQYFDRPDVVEVQTPTTATSAVTAIDNLDFDTVVPRRGWYYE
ncbi:unnamed protein product [Didymodactylos carnosus]|uniref:E3 ubiquitin-protein ligase n=1 Tax=Didymodactylos carnosus TaxID=1234261 RepID=A0A816BVB3_9BILA|nr:unnamed protein product [Didymodactylos carnosus]CAF4498049.1 unnamed protein product [Didymodactylos carnosus]